MPVISVKMTHEDGGLNKLQKEKLARELTDAFVRVVGRGAKSLVLLIDEIPTDNYAVGGQTVTNIRLQSK